MVCLMCITYFLYNHLSEKFSPNQSQRPHYTKYPADPKVYICFINKLGSSTHLDFCAGFSSADCRVTRNTLRHRICCLFSCRATHRRVDSQQQHTGVARAATQPPPTTTTTTPNSPHASWSITKSAVHIHPTTSTTRRVVVFYISSSSSLSPW